MATTAKSTTANATAAKTSTAKSSTGALVRTGVLAIAIASAATIVVAVVGRAAGISLNVNGAPIPIVGFGSLTAVFSFMGLLLAAVLSRTARHAQRIFIRTTVVLTVLSLAPDVLADAGAATKALLVLTHLVAAAIVIPAVARRLPA